MNWVVYIIRANNGNLYTGITNNLPKRLKDHQTGKGARFFRFSAPNSVVYQEFFPDRSLASKREWEIKKMKRSQKFALIAQFECPVPPPHSPHC